MNASSQGIASRLASQSGLLMLGNLFTLVAGFPFQIYVARTIGADQLGAFGLFEVIAHTAAALVGLGLGFSLVRFLPEYLGRGQSRHIRTLLGAVFAMTALVGAGAAVAVNAASSWLIVWLPELQPYASLLPFIGAMIVMGLLTSVAAQALRGFFDIRYMVLVASFLQIVLKIAIALVLLWAGWELFGYLVAVVVSAAAALAGMLWGIRRHVRGLARSDDEVLPEARKAWWAYARTMYGNSMLSIAGAPLERFLLAGAIDLASVGILMAARQLQNFSQVLLQAIIAVIAPMFVAARTRNDVEEVRNLFRLATDWICRLGFPLLVFLAVFGDEVLGLYGAAFAKAGYRPLLIMIAGQFVNLATGPIGNMLNMLGHEKVMFQKNVISNALALLALVTLAPLLGLVGVAIAGVVSVLYLNTVALRMTKDVLGFGWWSERYKRLLAPVVGSLALMVLMDATDVVEGVWGLVAALALSYGVFALMYLLRGLDQEDKEVYAMVLGRLGLASRKK
jgi:O-antigen/teichoic acid export membrane protein